MPTPVYRPYEQMECLSGKIGDLTLSFHTKLGLSDWKQITPASALLAEVIQPAQTDRTLVIGCHHGALSAVLGKRVNPGLFFVLDNDLVALTCTEMTLRANDVLQFTVAPGHTLLPQAAGTFDLIAFETPKGRKLSRHWLLEAFTLLKTGGSLVFAGANDLGIQSILRDAQELFGNAVILGYKKGHRAAKSIKKEGNPSLPAWAGEPGIAPNTWMNFSLEVQGSIYQIFSLPGVFAADRLDEGTALLLNTVKIPGQAKILDMGCGNGIIGIHAAAQQPSSQVDLLDSNLLAVAAAQKNLVENHLQNAHAFASDLMSQVEEKTYSLILANPPFHTGKEVNYAVTEALLRQAYHRLQKGGTITLVANQFIRYDLLMREVFQNAKMLAQTPQYHVLSAVKQR